MLKMTRAQVDKISNKKFPKPIKVLVFEVGFWIHLVILVSWKTLVCEILVTNYNVFILKLR